MITGGAAGPTLAQLSEEELLRELFPLFAPQPGTLVGPGDDAAVLETSGPVVVTTDSMCRGRDWLDEWSSAADVGAKLLTQNLADLAAMGAASTSVVMTLVADPATPAQWVLDLAASIAAGCAAEGVTVAGGDLSSAPSGTLVVSITALGSLEGRSPVLRSGARAGDCVVLRGALGRSAAGLVLLQTGAAGRTDPPSLDALTQHRRPSAPLAAGPQVALAGANAMLDVSDGLLRDGARIATASGVRLDLDAAALAPLVEALVPVVGEPTALECVLAGGEEHSLLACMPRGSVPPGWRVIGEVTTGAGVTLGGEPQQPRGWDHFAG